jgi:hypothetical protein
MANEFSKEERVAFEDILEGFDDQALLSKAVAKFSTDQTMMARTNDIIWRPQPNISRSFDGLDQTGNFLNQTQLSVPSTIGYKKVSPWTMDALELRDALQEKRLGVGARQKLTSDINVAVTNVACLQGTLVVSRSGASGDFDDIAACETIMNEQGVPEMDRYIGLSTRDYNGIAGNLQVASRSFGNKKSDNAFEKAFVGEVANFSTLKLPYTRSIRAATITATMSTLVGAGNFYVPQATTVSATGESSNVDNRYQTITVNASATMEAGDAFTIIGVNAVHHITKEDTGQLKTFRVISVPSGTTVVISPPIISGQGGSNAELQYQNCIVTASGSAAIDQLNTNATQINPFWVRDSIEILPGRLAIPANAGMAVMRGTTDQGLEVVMSKQADIDNLKTKFRIDVLFGVVNLQPEMTGILLFNQP